MQTAEREEEEEKTIHGGGIYGQVSVYLNTGEGELFDAGHREGYSFVAASSRSYLVNQRGLAGLLRGYEIPAVGRGSFPRTGRKARERGRRDPGRKS